MWYYIISTRKKTEEREQKEKNHTTCISGRPDNYLRLKRTPPGKNGLKGPCTYPSTVIKKQHTHTPHSCTRKSSPHAFDSETLSKYFLWPSRAHVLWYTTRALLLLFYLQELLGVVRVRRWNECWGNSILRAAIADGATKYITHVPQRYRCLFDSILWSLTWSFDKCLWIDMTRLSCFN